MVVHVIDATPDRSPLVLELAVDRARPGGEGVLSYALPPELTGRVDIGQLVWVPLRRQTVLGIVLASERRVTDFLLKDVIAPVEPAFRLTTAQLEIVRWLARETACGLFTAAAPFLPPGVTHRAVIHLEPTGVALEGLTPAQQRLADLVRDGGLTLDAARKALGSSLASVVPALEAKGGLRQVVRVIDRPPGEAVDRFLQLRAGVSIDDARGERQEAVLEYLIYRDRFADSERVLVPVADVIAESGADARVIAAMVKRGLIEEVTQLRPSRRVEARVSVAPALTPGQAVAWNIIEQRLNARSDGPVLLQGVTGSGKTELYLRAVAWCLRQRLGAIVLVPEIALASQIVRRFEARFPGQVAIMHSAMAGGERYREWQQIARGERPIVVGPRSALFAPVQPLGLVIVDEEHEPAYKQEAEPRYHARALAEQLCARSKALLLLGSATPSVETRFRAGNGEIEPIALADRIPDASGRPLQLPDVEIVDMRAELHRGNSSLLSLSLQRDIERTLAAGEQAMLLLNRRGSATIVQCRSCGETVQCPNCDIPLVFHADRDRLLCHRCNHRQVAPIRCTVCGGGLNYHGAGTQRVEDEVRKRFPRARVIRWDFDAVRRAGGHERILRQLERREADIVVGTQMIAKGLDLPMVSTVGVVHADTMLHLPDFRSGERTFQLLTQVAGRAGRRAGGGRVVIQTYSPAHYAIVAAAGHDFEGFYAEEIEFRKIHGYPPFTRLARYTIRDEKEAVCAAESDEMARALARHCKHAGVAADFLGPAPAFASRIRGRYQWQIVLRAAPAAFDRLLDGLPVRPGWTVDVDPQSLL